MASYPDAGRHYNRLSGTNTSSKGDSKSGGSRTTTAAPPPGATASSDPASDSKSSLCNATSFAGSEKAKALSSKPAPAPWRKSATSASKSKHPALTGPAWSRLRSSSVSRGASNLCSERDAHTHGKHLENGPCIHLLDLPRHARGAGSSRQGRLPRLA